MFSSPGLITMAAYCMQFVSADEVRHVHFGSNVTLGCNISYLYDTTWFKQNLELTPTVLLRARLREGHPVQGA